MFLALLLGIVLVLLCASAALADKPIKVSMELSNNKFTGPKTINVSITVTNVGDGDLPDKVTLFYPSGKKIEDFALSAGASKRWSGEWTVTQSELEAGKVTFAVRYYAYDGPAGEDGEPKKQGHKINFTKTIIYEGEEPKIEVKRTITPQTAQKGQEVSVVYEIENTGSVEVTSVNIKENAAVSTKSGTIDSIQPGETKSYPFTFNMGTKDVTSAATISYKDKNKGKTYSQKVGSETIKYGQVNLSATLKADKKGGAPGDTVKLTLTLKNSGNLDFTNVTVTDAALGTVFSDKTVKAGETLPLETELTITDTVDLQFTVKADDTTGKGVETATGRVKVIATDPSQQIVLSLELEADRNVVYKTPGTVRFKCTVHNESKVDVSNVAVKAGDTELYRFETIPADGVVSFIRDVDANLKDVQTGQFQFTATCKDQLDQVLAFTSNIVEISYAPPTPEPTPAPTVTPVKPQTEPIPTDQPEPEWLNQAESVAESIKWIFAAIAAVLIALLLIGAVRRGKSRSESRKAMDHLEGGTYRDYSAVPKRRHRSEISNGGTVEEKAEEEKPEENEGTAQNSELMAETLRKLYSDKPEETVPEIVTETADAAADAAAEAADAAEEAAEAVEDTVKDAAESVQEAGASRRRRGRKQE